jgi:NAD(P)-dependent dehydrogenase (short-subunit alcohol dehydrogenase family)
MSDQVVLITGALTGIGRAAAIIFAQEGAQIVVSGRRDKEGQALVAELQGLGAEAIFVRTDVRKDEDVRNLVDQTVKRFGRLDVAVNNAGTEGTPGPVTEQTAESYAATFDTNVLGTLLSIKHELRVMLPQGSGSIVNVSSAYGSVRLCGQQTCDRGPDKIHCTGSRRDRSSGKRSRSGHYGHRYAHALH